MAKYSVVSIALVAFAMSLRVHWSNGQVVRLRRPESSSNLFFNPSLLTPKHNQDGASRVQSASSHFTNERPPDSLLIASQEGARRRTPVAGNVLVRFDVDHDIEHIQYVLQDGQLATIYKREQPGHSEQVHQQTIETDAPRVQLDGETEQVVAEQQGPNQLTFEAHQFDDEASKAAIENGDGKRKSETAEMLAAMAQNPVASSGQNFNLPFNEAKEGRLETFGTFLEKLRHKIKSKINLMPHVIQRKLNAKSSNGKLFVDREGGERVPIELQNEFHQEMVNNPMSRLQFQQGPRYEYEHLNERELRGR